MRFTVDRLDHVVLNVSDIEVAASWYQRVLGMEREEFAVGPDDRVALKFGGQKLNLRPHDTPALAWPTGAISTPGGADLCFVAAMGSDDVVDHLEHCGVTIENGPVSKTGALGPIQSVYCRDPDGNLIEIASYLGR